MAKTLSISITLKSSTVRAVSNISTFSASKAASTVSVTVSSEANGALCGPSKNSAQPTLTLSISISVSSEKRPIVRLSTVSIVRL